MALAICGGVIHSYGGDRSWLTELPEMLRDDREGVMDDWRSGDSLAERLIDSSLSTLDEQAGLIFMALGVCAEDVAVPLPVVHTL